MPSKRLKGLKGFDPTLALIREVKDSFYTVPQLMSITGMTPRQVRHWSKIRLVVPCFRDTKARGRQPVSRYSAKDVVRALIIREMTKRGFSLTQVRTVEMYLEQKGVRLNESAKYLITDGTTAYYAKDAKQVIDILKHQNQMLLIPVWEHMTEVKVKLRVA